MNNGTTNWNAQRWAVSFRIASERLVQAKAAHRRDWDADQAVHQLRADVFRDTVARVRAGGYLLPGAGRVDLALSTDIGADGGDLFHDVIQLVFRDAHACSVPRTARMRGPWREDLPVPETRCTHRTWLLT